MVKAFFAEPGLGMEEFEVSSGNQTFTNSNGFVSSSLGYAWYPWKRSGFYIIPKLTGTLTLFREEAQVFHTTTNFQLKPVFATPGIAIGWKFDFK